MSDNRKSHDQYAWSDIDGTVRLRAELVDAGLHREAVKKR
jgi:hypothetical protein